MNETTKPIEFTRGSRAELEKLTKLAAFTLPKLGTLPAFKTEVKVIYESKNDYHNGGLMELWGTFKAKDIFTKQARELYKLIFEYNCFSGLDWSYSERNHSGNRYKSYHSSPREIKVTVESPSQHERLEAAKELRSWLEGKSQKKKLELILRIFLWTILRKV